MKKVWFKAKKYGWGWYPASWQGWVVTLLYIFYVVYRVNTVSSVFELIIPTTILLVICLYTGERPRWRWGDKDKK